VKTWFQFFAFKCNLYRYGAVIDCEAVAYDRVEKKILPFQILSTRGRKNIDEADIKVGAVQDHST
jgi:ATP-dependent DNA ligase